MREVVLSCEYDVDDHANDIGVKNSNDSAEKHGAHEA